MPILLLITMWPLVSATKIYECHREYSTTSLFFALLFTAAGAVAWFLALLRGIELFAWLGTVLISDYSFWLPLCLYIGFGILRYGLFAKYDRDAVYARLVEDARKQRTAET